jgi:hypothetical protein
VPSGWLALFSLPRANTPEAATIFTSNDSLVVTWQSANAFSVCRGIRGMRSPGRIAIVPCNPLPPAAAASFVLLPMPLTVSGLSNVASSQV